MDALVEKGRNHCNGITSPSPRIIPLASYITDASRTLPTVEKVEDRMEGAVVGQLGTFDCPLILWMAIEGGRGGSVMVAGNAGRANGELNTMPIQFCNIIFATPTELKRRTKEGGGDHEAIV